MLITLAAALELPTTRHTYSYLHFCRQLSLSFHFYSNLGMTYSTIAKEEEEEEAERAGGGKGGIRLLPFVGHI